MPYWNPRVHSVHWRVVYCPCFVMTGVPCDVIPVAVEQAGLVTREFEDVLSRFSQIDGSQFCVNFHAYSR